MAREFAKSFYHSKEWKATRAAYFRYRNGLCEKCLSKGKLTAGEIVHHKEHLTPKTISNPTVTLSFANLELLCRQCHANEHPEINKQEVIQRIAFDENGNTVRLESNG